MNLRVLMKGHLPKPSGCVNAEARSPGQPVEASHLPIGLGRQMARPHSASGIVPPCPGRLAVPLPEGKRADGSGEKEKE